MKDPIEGGRGKEDLVSIDYRFRPWYGMLARKYVITYSFRPYGRECRDAFGFCLHCQVNLRAICMMKDTSSTCLICAYTLELSNKENPRCALQYLKRDLLKMSLYFCEKKSFMFYTSPYGCKYEFEYNLRMVFRAFLRRKTFRDRVSIKCNDL